ncbi:MAG: glycosyltransferase family 2 protein [Nitriliruptorales bacterium]
MSAPRSAVVVVSHETRDEALACLATLHEAGADEVVLVDCGSTDATAAAVRATHADVEVIALENVGYGRGANAGVAATTAPHVVVANADTRFSPGSVGALVAALQGDDGIGAAGPLVRYPDGRIQASARRFPALHEAAAHALLGLWWPRNRWTRRYRELDEDPRRERDVDWLSGCAMALRRRAFESIDGFDPAYFLYVEDVDLAFRLREEGWRIRYVPGAEVVHAVGASTRRRPRLRMLVEHARSLDRFFGRRLATGHARWLRPLVRFGLAVWVAIAFAWGLLTGRGRSTTGE